MNHHWSLLRVVLSGVFELEAVRQVIVYLNSTELPTTTNGILHHEVELWTIECSLAKLYAGVETHLCTSLLDSCLTLFPYVVRTDILLLILWVTKRNLSLIVLETEGLKHLEDDVDIVLKLSLYLVRAHEDVSIVLREGTNTCKSVKLTTLLVAEHGSKLSDTQWEIFIRTWLMSVNLTVVRTVHRLEHILLILLWCVDWLESILAIVGIVTRSYVEVLTTDTRCDYLLIVVRTEETTQEVLQTQAQLCTLRQPDRKTLTNTVREHKEFHLLTNLSVVALLSLLKHFEIFIEHLLLREGDTIDTCHLLTLSIATPESSSNAGYLDCLDSTRRNEVRTTTKVGEITL